MKRKIEVIHLAGCVATKVSFAFVVADGWRPLTKVLVATVATKWGGEKNGWRRRATKRGNGCHLIQEGESLRLPLVSPT